MKLHISQKPLFPTLPWIDDRVRKNDSFFNQKIRNFFWLSHFEEILYHYLIINISIVIPFTYLRILLRSSQLLILYQGQQDICNLIETLKNGVLNCFEPNLVDVIGVSSSRQKKSHHVNMIFFYGRDQRSLSSWGGQVWISFIFLDENIG